jgi:hypothetical protein
MGDLAAVGRRLGRDLTRGLEREETAQLTRLLTTIADQ